MAGMSETEDQPNNFGVVKPHVANISYGGDIDSPLLLVVHSAQNYIQTMDGLHTKTQIWKLPILWFNDVPQTLQQQKLQFDREQNSCLRTMFFWLFQVT